MHEQSHDPVWCTLNSQQPLTEDTKQATVGTEVLISLLQAATLLDSHKHLCRDEPCHSKYIVIPCTIGLMKQPLAQRAYILNYKTTLLAECVTFSLRESSSRQFKFADLMAKWKWLSAEVVSAMIPFSDFLLSGGFDEIRMVMACNTQSRCSRHLEGPNKTYVLDSAPPCNIECVSCCKKVTLNHRCCLDHSASKQSYLCFAIRSLNRHF